MDKIAALNEILELDPTNAFARYGLAMEHAAQGNPEAALAEFSTLIANLPDYVPAYQMSAQIMVKMEHIEAAAERLHAGLAAAARTGNSHATFEMQDMLDNFPALPKKP